MTNNDVLILAVEGEGKIQFEFLGIFVILLN